MKFRELKSLTSSNRILATIPVDNPSIFKGVCLDIEKNKKESAAYTLFCNLVKLADTCKLEISFNRYDYGSILVYSKGEPDKDQIDSIPLMDMTIRGMLQVIDTTLDYLRYIEEEPRPIILENKRFSRKDSAEYLFDLLKEGVRF